MKCIVTSDSFWRRLSLGDITGTVLERLNGLNVALACSILTPEYSDAIDALSNPSSASSSSLTPGSLINAVTSVWQPPQLTDSTLNFSNLATFTGRN